MIGNLLLDCIGNHETLRTHQVERYLGSTHRNGRKNDDTTVLASNRRARHDYTILDVVEAGIVLHGSEVKSVREGLVQIAEAYAHVSRGEMWLENMHISTYKFSHGVGAHEPVYPRKLLLNRSEIRRLSERMNKESPHTRAARRAPARRASEG